MHDANRACRQPPPTVHHVHVVFWPSTASTINLVFRGVCHVLVDTLAYLESGVDTSAVRVAASGSKNLSPFALVDSAILHDPR
jgi:hypothetical protein